MAKVSADRQMLFLDMSEVDEVYGVVQHVTEAKKHPLNPVLPLGDLDEWDSAQARPWESRSVVFDDTDGLFKCWYAGADITAEKRWLGGYAESNDGVRWVKPRLGLYEYNGNKDNNICYTDYYGPILLDAGESDLEKRFKMIMQRAPKAPRGASFQIGYSAEGKHWCVRDTLELQGLGHGVAFVRDDQSSDPNRRYMLFGQTSDTFEPKKPGLEKEYGRSKCLAFSPDALKWTFSSVNPVLTPNGSPEHENHFLQIIPYRGYYVLLYEYGWYVPNGYGTYGTYCADIRLAVSRDGEHYTRIQPHQAVIRRGRYGEWDDGFLCISDKAVVKDDTIYLYYCGQGHEWTSWPGENCDREKIKAESSGCIRLSRMGLATLPIDGFTYLQTKDGETPGYVVTKPMEAGDPRTSMLTVNVDGTIPRRSWLDVEVVDAQTGTPISGLKRADCHHVDEDGRAVTIRWGETKSLAAAGSRQVALRFWFYGGVRLYSCGFTGG